MVTTVESRTFTDGGPGSFGERCGAQIHMRGKQRWTARTTGADFHHGPRFGVEAHHRRASPAKADDHRDRIADLERRIDALELEPLRELLTRPGLMRRLLSAIFC
jgi:hypothetical protein